MYVPKTSKVLENPQFVKFWNEADDKKYLAAKVANINGVFVACRRQEITELTMAQYTGLEDCLKSRIDKAKNRKVREFVIIACQEHQIDYSAIINKYVALQPANVVPNRLFLYQAGKCRNQPIGINTLGSYPKEIAITQ